MKMTDAMNGPKLLFQNVNGFQYTDNFSKKKKPHKVHNNMCTMCAKSKSDNLTRSVKFSWHFKLFSVFCVAQVGQVAIQEDEDQFTF